MVSLSGTGLAESIFSFPETVHTEPAPSLGGSLGKESLNFSQLVLIITGFYVEVSMLVRCVRRVLSLISRRIKPLCYFYSLLGSV